MIQNSFQNRVLGKSLFGAAMLACALWGAAERPLAVEPRFSGCVTRPADDGQIARLREAPAFTPSADCACAGSGNG